MSDVPESPRNEPVETLVAVRAYEIWEQSGRPDGEQLSHWLQAEAEVLNGHAQGETVAEPAAAKA